MYNEHLSIEQIEALSQRESQPSEQKVSEEWSHVESCDQCSALLKRLQVFNIKLSKLASMHLSSRSDMDCHDQSVWFDVAGGTLSNEESFQLIQHAATCNKCGKMLGAAMRIFDDELSSEDEATVRELRFPIQSDNSKTQLGRYMRWPLTEFWQPLWVRTFYSVSVMFICVLLGLAAIGMYRQHQKDAFVEQYTSRPIEYRLANLPYRRPNIIRGAREKLYIHVSGHAPTYLRASAALLRLDSEAAVNLLEDAIRSGDHSEPVLDDLVVAYALKADQTGSNKYLQTALQKADDAIQHYPNDSIAYFNKALVYNNMNCDDCSKKARLCFEQMLRIEKDPDWRNEAKEALDQNIIH